MARLEFGTAPGGVARVIDGCAGIWMRWSPRWAKAGDLEAAGAEVDDAHRAALAAVAEAEGPRRRRAAARHAHPVRRTPSVTAREADAVTQDALAETAGYAPWPMNRSPRPRRRRGGDDRRRQRSPGGGGVAC